MAKPMEGGARMKTQAKVEQQASGSEVETGTRQAGAELVGVRTMAELKGRRSLTGPLGWRVKE